MLWMGIKVSPHTVTLAQVGVDFRKIYVGSCPSDVVRSWLRLNSDRTMSAAVAATG